MFEPLQVHIAVVVTIAVTNYVIIVINCIGRFRIGTHWDDALDDVTIVMTCIMVCVRLCIVLCKQSNNKCALPWFRYKKGQEVTLVSGARPYKVHVLRSKCKLGAQGL